MTGISVSGGQSYASLIAQQQLQGMPTGAISEPLGGRDTALGNQSVLNSGILRLGARQMLPAGVPINRIVLFSGSTPSAPTNQWASLVRVSDRVLLAQTNDDAVVWAANSAKIFDFASPYVPAANEFVWLGCLVAGTVPSLIGFVVPTQITGIVPKTCGNSNSGLTVPGGLTIGNAVNDPTAGSVSFYGYTT